MAGFITGVSFCSASLWLQPLPAFDLLSWWLCSCEDYTVTDAVGRIVISTEYQMRFLTVTSVLEEDRFNPSCYVEFTFDMWLQGKDFRRHMTDSSRKTGLRVPQSTVPKIESLTMMTHACFSCFQD